MKEIKYTSYLSNQDRVHARLKTTVEKRQK